VSSNQEATAIAPIPNNANDLTTNLTVNNNNNNNKTSKSANFLNEDNEAKLKYVVEKIKSKLGKSLSASTAPVILPPPPPPLLTPQSESSFSSSSQIAVSSSSVVSPSKQSLSTTNNNNSMPSEISNKPLTPIKLIVNPNTNVIKKVQKQYHKYSDDNFLFEPYETITETSNNKIITSNTVTINNSTNNNPHGSNENLNNKSKKLHPNTRTNSCKRKETKFCIFFIF
jgi:hypothetical protein